MGFPRGEEWSGLSVPSGDLPDPGMEPVSPALQANYLPLSHQGKPILQIKGQLISVVYTITENSETMQFLHLLFSRLYEYKFS